MKSASWQFSWGAGARERIACIAGSVLLAGLVPVGTGPAAGAAVQLPEGPVDRQWYHHVELVAGPGLRAELHHTVVLHLGSTGARGTLVRNSIPYVVRETASVNFCVDDNEPHIRALTLLREDSPAVVVRVPRGRCKERTISAGLYRLHVDHDGRRVPPEGVTAFVHVPRRHDRRSGPAAGALPPIPPQNALQFVPECASSGFSWTSVDHPLFTFMVNGAYLGSATGTAGPLTTHPTAQDSLDGWSVCWSFGGTRVFFNGVNPSNVRAWALAGSDHKTVVETSGPADFDHKYLFTVILFDHAGQPFADWHFSLWGQNSHVEQGDIISQSSELHWAPIGWYGVANFNALYKVYRQGATVPDPESGQAHLVTAPCGQPSGPTYVAWQDFPDLDAAGIRAAGGVTIRPGPGTAVVAYPLPHYAGTPQPIGGGCLNGLPASLALMPLNRTLVVSTNACRYCDLTGIDLGGVNLTGGDFTGSIFNGANLTDTNFQSAILDDAQFRSFQAATSLAGTNFLGAHLRCTDFGNSDLRSAEFWSASPSVGLVIVRDFSCRLRVQWAHVNLDTFPLEDWRYLYLDHAQIAEASGQTLSSGAHPLDLSNALLSGTKGLTHVGLAGADLTGAQFIGTDLTGAILSGSVLSRADFTGATLTSANLQAVSSVDPTTNANVPARFTGATLTSATLDNARLDGADFTDATMNNAVGRHMSLVSAGLAGANLNFTNLDGANLCSASLGESQASNLSASLTGAFLRNVNLAKATLTGATLENANLYSAFPVGTCNSTGACGFLTSCASVVDATLDFTDFSGAYLNGVDFSGSTAQIANFSGAILVGANFTGVSLSNAANTGQRAHFNGAWLQGADFTNADATGADFANAVVNRGVTTPISGSAHPVLPDGNLIFPGYTPTPPSIPGCVGPAYNGVMTPPPTANVTCPDGSPGPCSAVQWESTFVERMGNCALETIDWNF